MLLGAVSRCARGEAETASFPGVVNTRLLGEDLALRGRFSYKRPVPVRLLQRRDHAQWLNLRRRLWPECPRARHIIEMRDLLTPPGRAAVFVFDRGSGRLGGFIEVTLREPLGDSMSPLVGYVEGWFVQPRLRRRGVGRALIAAAERWTARRGLPELASATELSNQASVRAHRKVGFEESYRLVHFLKKI